MDAVSGSESDHDHVVDIWYGPSKVCEVIDHRKDRLTSIKSKLKLKVTDVGINVGIRLVFFLSRQTLHD